LGVSVATSAAVFCTYFVLTKFLHVATYIPLLVGFIVVVGTPFILQYKRDLKYKASTFSFALAALSSVTLYVFLVLLLILNAIGT
jgi:hypothetical protein